jgi:hypothetical protein
MIVFTQDISALNNLMAYNNNVVRFTSDSGEAIIKATITIGGFPIVIYPTPDGTFYFNFKEYVTSFINQNNFKDTLVTNLDALDYETFSYAGSGFDRYTVTFEIELGNNTTETTTKQLYFLAGVEQIENYKNNVTQTQGTIILLPLYPNTNNKYYAKYFEGYPFDVSFLRRNNTTQEPIELVNNTNLLNFDFASEINVTRLFFSDGRIDESINDFLPIALGRNEISWLDKFLYIDKEDVCSGVYVKWFNNYGGYSYWLFPNFAKRDMSMRNIGELNQDFENLSNTNSQVTQIGIEAGERLTVNSDKLKEEEFNLLKTILTSPKIYLFTGEPFSQNDAMDWMEVRLATTSQTTRNYKGQALDITLNLELPDMYTQRL